MKHLPMTDALYEYMLDKSLREHPALKSLREDTSTMELANMQVAPEQAQFMQFLLRITGAKKVLELGTFTGYSALAMSLALPDDGQLITCDISAEWTKNAPLFWDGKVTDINDDTSQTREIKKLNDLIKNDKRVFVSLLPIADGLFLIQSV